jgi:hypothetical protein
MQPIARKADAGTNFPYYRNRTKGIDIVEAAESGVKWIQLSKGRKVQSGKNKKAKLYIRYPLFSVFIYNGSTIIHFLMGGIGIILGYNFSSWAGYTFGILYVLLSFMELYVIMPLTVCPNCLYCQTGNSLCVSGLNILSKRIAKKGDPKAFHKRAEGLFCQNNLYITLLIVPIPAMVPALIVNFSVALLVIFLAVAGLLLFRFFIIFPRTACLHCSAKYKCPQAEAMGVRDL